MLPENLLGETPYLRLNDALKFPVELKPMAAATSATIISVWLKRYLPCLKRVSLKYCPGGTPVSRRNSRSSWRREIECRSQSASMDKSS